MSFSSFVADYLLERLKEEQSLVVYDPEVHYREICGSLESKGVTVIDGDLPSLKVREELGRLWFQLAADEESMLLLYRPCRAPGEDAALTDPLSNFSQIMPVFPQPGTAHESYQSLARSAYPAQTEEIDALFASDALPSVAVLDNLQQGIRYPVLKSITGLNGTVDIIIHLLDRDKASLAEVLNNSNGLRELNDLLHATIGMRAELGNEALEARRKLWIYLLFSEFALDLPDSLPAAFADIPHAPDLKKDVVFQINKRLRIELLEQYVEEAESVAESLGLSALIESFSSFGQIDTFAFENTFALREAVRALAEDKTDHAAELIATAKKSIWASNDFTLQASWKVLDEVLNCLEALQKASVAELGADPVAWYRTLGMGVDKSYRAFVLSYARLEDQEPYGADLESLYELLAERYQEWITALQETFLKRISASQWPLPGLQRQDRLFSNTVQRHLAGGKRVAYFLVDALRYELGDALADKLEPMLKVEREAAAALLPSITLLGMAALTPSNDGEVKVLVTDDIWIVQRGERRLANASDRDDCFRSLMGDQCVVETLDTWLKRKKSRGPEQKIRLAVIRSVEIDNAGEHSEAVFRSSLENLMVEINRGIRKAFDYGFDIAVVTSDHGFLYLPNRIPGDQVEYPKGNTRVRGRRYAYGTFEKSESVHIFNQDDLGYVLPDCSLAVPAGTGSFSKPGPYVHEGLSLQEALIPVLSIQALSKQREKKVDVSIYYRKAKSGRVTSLTPIVSISVGGGGNEFDFEEEWANEVVEIDLRILGSDGKMEVGQVGPNDFLDTDTGLLRIRPGTTTTIPLRLNEDHRGKCVVKAGDPATSKLYDSIELEVDILE